jgi:hypothetical protein
MFSSFCPVIPELDVTVVQRNSRRKEFWCSAFCCSEKDTSCTTQGALCVGFIVGKYFTKYDLLASLDSRMFTLGLKLASSDIS